MIGYKAFDKNLCCNGFQFKVGETYETGALKENMCLYTNTVFHFCRELYMIEFTSKYNLHESRICEILSGDDIVTDDQRTAFGTNKITILREIVGLEKEQLLAAGYRNTGNYNKGKYNTGVRNTGDRNTGDHNIGCWNTGDFNKGNRNTGTYNYGIWNVGNHNTGNCNSGNRNIGNYNTGDNNTGDMNTGNYNTGDMNTGAWNTGDMNIGFFNTRHGPIRMFNKRISMKEFRSIKIPEFLYFKTVIWVPRSKASKEEKSQHAKEIRTLGGFNKELSYKEAFRLAWDNASKEEHKSLLNLPNWNNKIFKEISGIDAESEIEKENKED